MECTDVVSCLYSRSAVGSSLTRQLLVRKQVMQLSLALKTFWHVPFLMRLIECGLISSTVFRSLARATPVLEQKGLVIVLYTSRSNGMQLALAQFPTSPQNAHCVGVAHAAGWKWRIATFVGDSLQALRTKRAIKSTLARLPTTFCFTCP